MDMAESMIQSVIKCPICLESYEDPRVLSCLHSFCLKCLNGYILNLRMGPGQDFFTCPVCREKIYPPSPYRPLWQWSTQFRSNFIMTDLASCLTEVSKAKEESEAKATGEMCYPCSKQTGTVYPKEAEHFCLDCSHPYCEACMQVHMNIPSCQKHSIVAIDDHAAREQHKKQHLQCTEHPEEILKMFCEDCNQLLCPMCALLNHRQCSKLNSVTPMAAVRRQQLETSQKSLLSALSKAKEKQAKLREEKERLAQNITIRLREMDEAYDSLITTIKEQKKGDMMKTHEAIAKTQKMLASCEEQIGVFIAVLEENICKTQNRQLISSDIQLLQEVSQSDLREAENDVAAASDFLTHLESRRFDLPGMAKMKLEELKRMMHNVTLANTAASIHPAPQKDTGSSASASANTAQLLDHIPTKVLAGGSIYSQSSFALQLQQERLACRSVMSTSSDISAASTSSSEGSLACGHSSDGQRNPFSFVSSCGKKSVRRPTARPRNSLTRRTLSGASVFSVKHPVVTAANTAIKQSSPKKCCADISGFVFVPARNVNTLISHFKPVPKVNSAAPASDDSVFSPTLPVTEVTLSGAHTLPRSTFSRPAGAVADLTLPLPPKMNQSSAKASSIARAFIRSGRERPPGHTSLSVTNSTATMTSPSAALSTGSEEDVSIMSGSGDPSSQLNGATGPADVEMSLSRTSTGGEAAAAADCSSKLLGTFLQRTDCQKMKSIFKICPVSAGDSRRPSISDFAVLPNDHVVVVDRANSRVKLVLLSPNGQEGLCPSVDLTKPHGVCHMHGDLIAVVSHVAKTLQLVSVANHHLILQHTHNTCRGYLSIARLSPAVLAARFSLGVHILDVGGAALRLKATIVNDSEGKALFEAPISMCTTQDGKIIILDSIKLEVSSWDQSGAQLWCVKHATVTLPRSVCSVGLRRLYVISSSDGMDCLNCINASSGKLLHSVKLETCLKEVSTMSQDSQDRILINNVDEIVCFDWN